MAIGRSLLGLWVSVLALPAAAQSSSITESMTRFSTSINGAPVTITRSGAACPSRCVQPMQAAAGVVTVGELEVLDFLDLFVASGQGLLIDARLPEGFAGATLPGAVNVPAETLNPTNPYRDDLLTALGVVRGNFSSAFDLVILGAGPDDPEPVKAVRSLLDAGYPPAKLKYYRGGLQNWTGLGLSTATGQ